MKRILKLERHVPHFEEGVAVRAAISMDGISPESLRRFGFIDPFEVGQTVLPSQTLGPAARKNANGAMVIHRDQPKEQVSYLQSWPRMEWHGPDQVKVENIILRTRERYPRTYLPGTAVEFTIYQQDDGQRVIASRGFDVTDEADLLLAAANVVLEGFSRVEFLRENLLPVLRVPVRRLNWEIFPQGRVPWDGVHEAIDRVIERAPPTSRPVIHARTRQVEQYGPDFVAMGRAGFDGYIVFGFADQNLYVLESRFLDNATYVLGADWEAVSRLTKADVINSNLAVARLIHDGGWTERLDAVLRERLQA